MIQLDAKKWVVQVTDDDTGKIKNVDFASFKPLGKQAVELLKIITGNLSQVRSTTQETILLRIRPELNAAIRTMHMKKLPTNEHSWQDFVLDFYELVLTRRDSNKSLKSRVKVWNNTLMPLLI